MVQKGISKTVLQRLPLYLHYLKTLPDPDLNIPSAAIASALNLGEVQVRKDLALVSSSGKPKTGYVIARLIKDLETFLGYKDLNNAVIIGAGKLGKALLTYEGFCSYGLNIVAAFDISPTTSESDKNIFHLDKLSDLCNRMGIQIGIITVPAPKAQETCDLMIKNGIKAIWNFAPIHLDVPEGILVQNENMAASLALLSKHLSEKMNQTVNDEAI